MARKTTTTQAAVKSTRKVSSRTTAKSVKKKAPAASKAATATATKTTAAKSASKSEAEPVVIDGPQAEIQAEPKTKAATKARAKAKATASTKAAKVSQADASDDISDTPLSGVELLKKVKELGNLSKEEKAKACGYSATTKSGRDRVNLMKFYNALIEAEGIDLDGKKGDTSGRGGRSASYRITVQSNGNLLIGAAYTKQMDLNPGDEFQITLGRKHIKLTQVDEDSDD
ncbi:MAG: hypothetical protein HC824_14050 [Synechococcales cyanobacterium RM1_1_8]|nr:hypothetical protein [Synechococcales cyanobacterium RM1_1_8]